MAYCALLRKSDFAAVERVVVVSNRLVDSRGSIKELPNPSTSSIDA